MRRLSRNLTSVRWRLTLWNTITFASLLLLLGLVFSLLARRYLYGALDREMTAQAKRMQEFRTVKQLMVSEETATSAVTLRIVNTDRLPELPANPANARKSVHVEVVRDMAAVIGDRSGQFQYRSFGNDGKPFATPNLSGPPKYAYFAAGSGVVTLHAQAEQYKPWDTAALEKALSGEELFTNVAAEGGPMRVMSLPLRESDRIIGAAQISAPLAPLNRDLAGLTRTLFFVLPPALLIVCLAGVFLTDRALRPVKALTHAATGISPNQLQQRLPVSGADEFDELASAFNRALDRVELAFDERERMVEQLQRFTGDASHELRTPLTTIKANAGVALSDETPSEEHVHALRQIERAANRMTSLVDDLLLLARSDAGQLPQMHTSVQLRSVLEEAVGLLPAFSDTAAVRISCSEDLEVSGDSDQLLRLFRNLLENAVRHTGSEGSITAAAARAGSTVCVTISDTGCGIAPGHVPHLGERFYRADAGRNRRQGGAGLGLAICRSIVSRHGGVMSIESAVGVGTTVTVVLPVLAGRG